MAHQPDHDLMTLADLEALAQRYRDGAYLAHSDMLRIIHMAKHGIRLDPQAPCVEDMPRPAPPKCPRCGATANDICREL